MAPPQGRRLSLSASDTAQGNIAPSRRALLTHLAASSQVPVSTPGRAAARRGPEKVITADGSQYSVGGVSACTPMAVEAAYQLLRVAAGGWGEADLQAVLQKVLQVGPAACGPELHRLLHTRQLGYSPQSGRLIHPQPHLRGQHARAKTSGGRSVAQFNGKLA